MKVPILSYKEHTELFGVSFQVCNTTTDRKHADTFLEKCVTESIMNIVSGFFNSPFSDNSTSLQVTLPKSKKHPVRSQKLTHEPYMTFYIIQLSDYIIQYYFCLFLFWHIGILVPPTRN